MARQRLLGKNERVAVIVTGNGLKDIESAKKSVGEPAVVDSDLDQLRGVMGSDLRI
jgi:threonine synthase